ncbi:MAG TPA: hypothetical protein VFS52_24215 [Steroidobacteraceae bacterium]|jgi:hypothetical protein|nr:hypothetical protein [Steroidobacteraceae bacterium]
MLRRARTALLAATMAVAYPMLANASDSQDPLVGTWQLNLEKSSFDPGPGPKGQMRVYTHSGDVEKLTARGVGSDSKPTLVQYTARYDGKDYPITGSAGGDHISLRRIDELTTESTEKRAGKITIVATRTVSPDGKTLTVVHKGIDPHGKPMNHRMVFEKH